MIRRNRLSIVLMAVTMALASNPPAATAQGEARTAARPHGVDPLTAQVRADDADRFAEIFAQARGQPTESQLQTGYLDGAGAGVEIFTGGRIRDAANLAEAIAKDPAAYERAIRVCLPIAKAASADLRAIYLGLAEIFPDRPLPELHVVFGAGNSGGTVGVTPEGNGAQVLGLEVICATSKTPAEIRRTLRRFFAHETVHVIQNEAGAATADYAADPLLVASLREGFADFIAGLVTGDVPDPERDDWARARESQVWTDFAADRHALAAMMADGVTLDALTPDALALIMRWHMNYGIAPDGWPSELGYWVGQRVCQTYFDRAEDKRKAIADLLIMKDPEAIFAASGVANSPAAH